jgi:acylphosphatase
MKKKILIKIFGQVQGVFFRSRAQQIAESLNISGVARNLGDGTVEIVAEGDEKNLEKLLEWCHQGPQLARVEKVESSWEKPTGEFEIFKVEY